MKFKKGIFSIIVLALLVLPTVVFAGTYGYSFDFKYRLTSDLFYLDPDNSTAEVYMENTSSTYNGGGDSDVFYVDLYIANNMGVGELEGTQKFARDGTTKQGFIVSKTGNEKYGFTMRKSDDGQYVNGHGSIWD